MSKVRSPLFPAARIVLTAKGPVQAGSHTHRSAATAASLLGSVEYEVCGQFAGDKLSIDCWDSIAQAVSAGLPVNILTGNLRDETVEKYKKALARLGIDTEIVRLDSGLRW